MGLLVKCEILKNNTTVGPVINTQRGLLQKIQAEKLSSRGAVPPVSAKIPPLKARLPKKILKIPPEKIFIPLPKAPSREIFAEKLPESIIGAPFVAPDGEVFAEKLPESIIGAPFVAPDVEVFAEKLPESIIEVPVEAPDGEVFAEKLPESVIGAPFVAPDGEVFAEKLPESIIEAPVEAPDVEVFAEKLPESVIGAPFVAPDREVFAEKLPENIVEVPFVAPVRGIFAEKRSEEDVRAEEAAFKAENERRRNARGKPADYTDRRGKRRSTDKIPVIPEDRRKDALGRRHAPRSTEGRNTLSVLNLKKNFGKKEVVRGVGFSIKGGDIAGLLGPNGAGKTTIFYMIVGFYRPTSGDIKLNNASIISGPMYRRARMGIAYLPQEPSIFRKLSVEDNIWAILQSQHGISKKQKKEKLETLIADFGIGHIRKQLGYTLSGGERRRTEIARALATEPKFLLLDEPFAGIDPIAVFEIKQIIKRLSERGIGILITDHNVRDTLEITTDAFIISGGLILARGNKEHILANQTVRDVYLGANFKM
jgi:lipopolysaccharide export system ATP-binding protein